MTVGLAISYLVLRVMWILALGAVVWGVGILAGDPSKDRRSWWANRSHSAEIYRLARCRKVRGKSILRARRTVGRLARERQRLLLLCFVLASGVCAAATDSPEDAVSPQDVIELERLREAADSQVSDLLDLPKEAVTTYDPSGVGVQEVLRSEAPGEAVKNTESSGSGSELTYKVGKQLTATMRQEVEEFLQGKRAAFAATTAELPGYVGEDGDFDPLVNEEKVRNAKGLWRPPRPQNAVKDKLQDEVCQPLLEQGIIEQSNSSVFASNPVYAPKKDEDGVWSPDLFRYCLDYRAANTACDFDQFRLPSIEKLLGRLHGATLFSAIDLRMGFYNIGIKEEHRDVTSFWWKKSLYRFTRMPFGLKNAPGKFQRVMEKLITGDDELKACVEIYVDDLLLHTPGEGADGVREHLRLLGKLINVIGASGLRMHPGKSVFVTDELEYLGHKIRPNRISPQDVKVKAIRALAPPTSVADIKAKLGFLQYYATYVPNFSARVEPIRRLLKQGIVFAWEDEQQEAWSDVVNELVNGGRAVRPADPAKAFIVHTDFSNKGIGAVLAQRDDEGNEYMVATASRALNTAESRYASFYGEALAAVWAVKVFRQYLYGVKFLLVTDHQPLLWLMRSQTLSAHHTRWAVQLAMFEFDICHRAGVKHQNADGLSREPLADSEDETGARIDGDTAAPTLPRVLFSLVDALAAYDTLKGNEDSAHELAGATALTCTELVGTHEYDSNSQRVEQAALPVDCVLATVDTMATHVRAASPASDYSWNTLNLAPVPRRFHFQVRTQGVTVVDLFGTSAFEVATCLGMKIDNYVHCTDDDSTMRSYETFMALTGIDVVVQVFRAEVVSIQDVIDHVRAPSGRVYMVARVYSKAVHEQVISALKRAKLKWEILFVVQVQYHTSCECTSPWVQIPMSDARLCQEVEEGDVLYERSNGLYSAMKVQRIQGVRTLVDPYDALEVSRTVDCRQLYKPFTLEQVYSNGIGKGHITELLRKLLPAVEYRHLEQYYAYVMEAVGSSSWAPYIITMSSGLWHGPRDDPVQVMPTCGRCSCFTVAKYVGFAVVATSTDTDEGLKIYQRLHKRHAPLFRLTYGLPEQWWGGTGVAREPSKLFVVLRQYTNNLNEMIEHAKHGAEYVVCIPAPWRNTEIYQSIVVRYPLWIQVLEATARPPLLVLKVKRVNSMAFAVTEVNGNSASHDPLDDKGLVRYLQTREVDDNDDIREKRRVVSRAKYYSWKDGKLWRRMWWSTSERDWLEVPDKSRRVQLIWDFHVQNGHFGVARTAALVKSRYWWPSLDAQVAIVLAGCVECDRIRASVAGQTSTPLQSLPIVALLYRWGVDLTGELAQSRNGYVCVMVAVEHYSRFVELIPLRSKSSAATTDAFSRILGRYGAPAEVITDNGGEFKKDFDDLLEENFIDHRTTSTRHPQSNGAAERMVQVVKRAVKKYVDGNRDEVLEWDKVLWKLQLGYNASPQSSTKYSPYVLMHAQSPVVPPAVRDKFTMIELDRSDEDLARELYQRAMWLRNHSIQAGNNLATAQHRDEHYYNRRRGPERFVPGDYVYVRRDASTGLEASVRRVVLRLVERTKQGVWVVEGREGKHGRRVKLPESELALCHLPIPDEVGVHRNDSCEVCGKADREAELLLCDECMRAYHMSCVGVSEVKEEELWFCPDCVAKGVGADIPAVPVEKEEFERLAKMLEGKRGVRSFVVRRGGRSRLEPFEGKVSYRGYEFRPRAFHLSFEDGHCDEATLLEAFVFARKSMPEQERRGARRRLKGGSSRHTTS